ncbi:hypothetical protein AB1P65_09440 [Roseibium alexandrii]
MSESMSYVEYLERFDPKHIQKRMAREMEERILAGHIPVGMTEETLIPMGVSYEAAKIAGDKNREVFAKMRRQQESRGWLSWLFG